MIARLNSIVRTAWLWRHLLPAIVRHAFGRWFVFRGAPDVLVRFVCIYLASDALSDDPAERSLVELHQMAVDEWALRRRRRGVKA